MRCHRLRCVAVTLAAIGALAAGLVVAGPAQAAENSAPSAADIHREIHSGGLVNMTLQGTDPDDDELTYTIDADHLVGGSVRFVGHTVQYVADVDFVGTDTFSYTVTDGRGGEATADVTVTVGPNAAPVAHDVVGNVSPGASAKLRLEGSDPDGDQLTYSLPDSGGVHGTATVEDRWVTFTPTAGYTGPAWFFYTADDGHGASVNGFVKFTVMPNHAPKAPDKVITAATGITTGFTLKGFDPDGDPLTFSLPNSGGMHGTARVTSGIVDDGAFAEFTPTPGYIGPAWFFYTVDDGRGGTTNGFVKFTITPNQAPIAPDARGTVMADRTGTVKVKAWDPNIDEVAYSLPNSGGTHGTATIEGGGYSPATVTFTPTPGYVGPAWFFYTASDLHGGTTTGFVKLTVTPHRAPTAPDVRGTVKVTLSATVGFKGNGSGGDHLTYMLPNSGGVHGEATVHGDQVTFIPDAGYTGPAWFFYTVIDDHGVSADGFVKFTVVKVTSATYIELIPSKPTTTSTVTVGVGVVAPGVTITGSQVTVYDGARKVGEATITGVNKGRVDITLSNKLTKGTHLLKAIFAGNKQATASSRTVAVRVTN